MEVVQNPAAAPACCLFCPNSVRERYIDSGLSLDFVGAIYVCDQCVFNMGRLLGMASAEQFKTLTLKLDRQEQENYELTKQVVVLRSAVNTYLKDMIDVPSLGTVDTAEPFDSHPVFTDDKPSDKEPQGREDALGTGTGKAVKPLHDERVDKLHSDEPATKSFSLDLD